ncbi:hypothetical protein ACFC9N_11245 [Enterococcus casseliflavus]|uniref:hypothetical protein n=1 Tax=Enterococcus TaxID=1350 RepID=UPI000A393885|nr:hypothetical protein [Enterococcus sp. 4E1_DIV0656]OTO09257.1 hypothetical protein A5882_003590 [Enterococcus sp. 4E1_DIV0656]
MKEILPPPPPPKICTQDIFIKCENNSLCQFCKGCSLYKNKSEEKQRKNYAKQENKKNRVNDDIHKVHRKMGMDLEKKVQDQWNSSFNKKKKKKVAKPSFGLEDDEIAAETSKKESPAPLSFNPYVKKTKLKQNSSTYGFSKNNEAKRQVNSGAMWFAKGDIKLEHALMEVKERGTVNGRGEKTISIPKDWLVKQESEALQEQKDFWYLPFAYKNDDRIYLVKPYEQEISMIQDLRKLEEEKEVLLKEIERLKQGGRKKQENNF